jgi:pyruvyl transferase EpsI
MMLPEHGNSGDIAIAFSQINFLKKYFHDFTLGYFTFREIIVFLPIIKKIIKKHHLLVFVGGGSMGTLYPYYEGKRLEIINQFKDNKIVLFPQSLDWINPSLKFSDSFFKTYNFRNILISFRDNFSRSIFERVTGNKNSVLVPDIVLFNKIKTYKKRNIVLYVLRDDIEKKLFYDFSSIKDMYTLKHVFFDTRKRFFVPVFSYNLFLKFFYSKIGSSKFVITDRLHGVIFSYITKTPVLAIPSINHKIKGILEWFKGNFSVRYLINFDQSTILEQIELLENSNFIVQDFSELFDNFAIQIRLFNNE